MSKTRPRCAKHPRETDTRDVSTANEHASEHPRDFAVVPAPKITVALVLVNNQG